EDFRGPQRVHRCKRLVILLRPTPASNRKQTSGESSRRIDGGMLRVGAVDRQRRSVVTVFREHVAADVESPTRTRLIARRSLPGLVSRSEVRIDRSPRSDSWLLLFGDWDVAVSREPFAGAAVSPVAGARAAEQRYAACTKAATFDEHAANGTVWLD